MCHWLHVATTATLHTLWANLASSLVHSNHPRRSSESIEIRGVHQSQDGREMTDSSAGWNGNAMSQDDMMLKDTVVVLNETDDIIGSASKKESHVFSLEQPRGVLHRAFSVFVFDESTGDLLLATTRLDQDYISQCTYCSICISVFVFVFVACILQFLHLWLTTGKFCYMITN
jgi:hypothetical protein